MLNAHEIQTLNAARHILEDLARAAQVRSFRVMSEECQETRYRVDGHDLGRLSGTAETAAHLIFETLNVAHNYCQVDMSDEELYARRGADFKRGETARLEFLVDDSGYDLNDPKHPDFHSIRANLWDAREGK